MTTTTMIELDDLVTMIEDITDGLGVHVHPDAALSEWLDKKHTQTGSTVPQEWRASHASQAIADIIASTIKHGDKELVNAAMQDMDTDDGWQFCEHNVVLWVQVHREPYTLVVWFGNDRDFDMCRIGEARINY